MEPKYFTPTVEQYNDLVNFTDESFEIQKEPICEVKYDDLKINHFEKINNFKKLVADKLNIDLSILLNMSVDKICELVDKSSIDYNEVDGFVDWTNNNNIGFMPCDFKKNKSHNTWHRKNTYGRYGRHSGKRIKKIN